MLDDFSLSLVQDSADSIIDRIDRLIPILDGVVDSHLVSVLHGAKQDAIAIKATTGRLRDDMPDETEEDPYKCHICGKPGGH